MMLFLTNTYYLLWLIALWIEIHSFNNPEYVLKMRSISRLSREQRKNIIHLNMPGNILFFMGVIIETLIIAVGLVSSQWVICLILMVAGIFIKGRNPISLRTNSIVCQALIVLLLLNKFVFHIHTGSILGLFYHPLK